VQALHPIATAGCIVLTLAFGISCLCASTIMDRSFVDAHHGPGHAYALVHAVSPHGGK
jgi:hypothetical protein